MRERLQISVSFQKLTKITQVMRYVSVNGLYGKMEQMTAWRKKSRSRKKEAVLISDANRANAGRQGSLQMRKSQSSLGGMRQQKLAGEELICSSTMNGRGKNVNLSGLNKLN